MNLYGAQPMWGTSEDVIWEACGPDCAEPVPCPDCGADLPPVNRNAAGFASLNLCCAAARNSDSNTRHIWTSDELRIQARRL